MPEKNDMIEIEKNSKESYLLEYWKPSNRILPEIENTEIIASVYLLWTP